ncbi:MAG: AMP-binding protein [Pseudomonadota bacterium]
MAFKIYCLSDLLFQHQGAEASRIALIDGDQSVTYAALMARTRFFAVQLQQRGIKRSDRVAIFMRRSVDAVASFFAVHYLGAVAVILNDKLKPQQIDHIVNHAGASGLVTERQLSRTLTSLELQDCFILNVEDLGDGVDNDNALGPCRVIGQDLALIIYTSGSTGLPKGIMLSHNNLLSGAEIISDFMSLTKDDRLISLLPFSFDYGLNQLLTMMLVGGTLVIQRSLFPADICRTLQKHEVTGMAGVPLLWSQLAGPYSPFNKSEFPKLRYISNTGGVFPENLVKLYRQTHPHLKIYLMYGLTEAFRSTILPSDQVDKRPKSMGKAIPNVEILVVNDEQQECAPGEPGELVHRGANIALGYWRDRQATEKVYRPHPYRRTENGMEEMVVYSGDIVKKDEEGYLYFVGRKDGMIKNLGVRVSPEEIEHHIYASGLVSGAVAFSRPRDDTTNDIVAVVAPRNNAEFDESQLQAYCAKEMPEYMRPTVFSFMDELPKLGSGKPDRQAIREAFLAQQ